MNQKKHWNSCESITVTASAYELFHLITPLEEVNNKAVKIGLQIARIQGDCKHNIQILDIVILNKIEKSPADSSSLTSRNVHIVAADGQLKQSFAISNPDEFRVSLVRTALQLNAMPPNITPTPQPNIIELADKILIQELEKYKNDTFVPVKINWRSITKNPNIGQLQDYQIDKTMRHSRLNQVESNQSGERSSPQPSTSRGFATRTSIRKVVPQSPASSPTLFSIARSSSQNEEVNTGVASGTPGIPNFNSNSTLPVATVPLRPVSAESLTKDIQEYGNSNTDMYEGEFRKRRILRRTPNAVYITNIIANAIIIQACVSGWNIYDSPYNIFAIFF